MERLTPSEGQPVDHKELELLGLAAKGCVPDGPPFQVAVFASVDVMKSHEDVNADDLVGPLAFFVQSGPHGPRT